jgi:hypothetical protein
MVLVAVMLVLAGVCQVPGLSVLLKIILNTPFRYYFFKLCKVLGSILED